MLAIVAALVFRVGDSGRRAGAFDVTAPIISCLLACLADPRPLATLGYLPTQ